MKTDQKVEWKLYFSRPARLQRACNFVHAMQLVYKNHFRVHAPNWLCVSDHGSTYFYRVKSEAEQVLPSIVKTLKKPSYMEYLHKDYPKQFIPHLNFMRKIEKQDLSLLSKKDLLKLFKQFKESELDYQQHMSLIFIIEPALDIVIFEILRRYLDDIEQAIEVVFSQTESNMVIDEAVSMKKIATITNSKKRKQALEKHWQQYKAMGYYDFADDEFTLSHFEKNLKQLEIGRTQYNIPKLKENKKKFVQFLKESRFKPNDLMAIQAAHSLFNLKEKRTEFRYIDSGVGKEIYAEIGERTKRNVLDLQYLTDDEIIDLLQHGGKVNISSRKNHYVVKIEGVAITVLDGKEAKKLQEKVYSASQESIQGVSASKGIAQGRAVVVVHPDQLRELKKGDILITTMTRPEFVAAMSKCSAIVTNEGGMLCHAAIVSRELGLPCVIGTQIATKIFKDGDVVEVDADKGIVRKL